MKYRAIKAPSVEGKEAWYGQYKLQNTWLTACSGYGAIRYTTPDYAILGAEISFKGKVWDPDNAA